MSEPEETYSTNDFECPYCHTKQSDSWEFASESGTLHECYECGGEFTAVLHISHSYYGYPIKEKP